MFLETIRVSQKAKDQLLRLKRTTGIKQWNILSRWALCISLADPNPPSGIQVTGDSTVEMSWKVFGGAEAELYAALVRQRCVEDGLGTDPRILAEQFRLHLHRGIGTLFGTRRIESIVDLVSFALQAREGQMAAAKKGADAR